MALLLPRYIKEELSAETYSLSIGISTIIIIPWFFKVVFGIITDNFPIGKYGRRKPYLVISTIISFIGWITLGLHDSANILFILSGLMLAVGSAFGDAVIDGQAVEITPTNFTSRLQGVAWGSRGLGIGVAGIASAFLITSYSWQTMFLVSGFFGVSITLITLLLPQGPSPSGEEDLSKKVDSIINSFSLIIRVKPRYVHLYYFFLSGICIAVVPMMSVIMPDYFGYTIEEMGIGALFFAIGSFLGALTSGVLFDQKDSFKRYAILTLLYAGSLILGLLFVSDSTMLMQLSLVFFIGITSASFEAFQLKVIQETSPESIEGTAFATFTGLSNLGQFLFGFLIVFIAELLEISIFIPLQIITIFVFLTLFVLRRMRYEG